MVAIKYSVPRAMYARLTEIAGDRLPSRYRDALTRYRYGLGVFKMDWALSDPIPWTSPDCGRAATVHLGGDYRDRLSHIPDLIRGQNRLIGYEQTERLAARDISMGQDREDPGKGFGRRGIDGKDASSWVRASEGCAPCHPVCPNIRGIRE